MGKNVSQSESQTIVISHIYLIKVLFNIQIEMISKTLYVCLVSVSWYNNANK